MIELFANGGVAQLGERCVRNAEVKGSIPSVSTKKSARMSALFNFLSQRLIHEHSQNHTLLLVWK